MSTELFLFLSHCCSFHRVLTAHWIWSSHRLVVLRKIHLLPSATRQPDQQTTPDQRYVFEMRLVCNWSAPAEKFWGQHKADREMFSLNEMRKCLSDNVTGKFASCFSTKNTPVLIRKMIILYENGACKVVLAPKPNQPYNDDAAGVSLLHCSGRVVLGDADNLISPLGMRMYWHSINTWSISDDSIIQQFHGCV